MGYLIIGLFLLIPLSMLVFLHRRLQHLPEGEGKSGNWILIIVMGWGFLWVGYKGLLDYLGESTTPSLYVSLFALTAVCGLIVYGVVFQRAIVKRNVEHLQQKMEEIGKESEE